MDVLPLRSDSDCPGPEAVQAEVRELTTVEQRRGVPSDAKVIVSDRGDSIAISITRDGKTTVRIYQDAARDCVRRAHFVSVLAVIALMPPDIGIPPPEPKAEPEPAPAERPPAPAPAGPRVASRRIRIELAGRAEMSTPIRDSVRVASLAESLGLTLGSADLRLNLMTGYTPGTTVRYTGAFAGSAELEQLDAALGMRLMLLHAPLDLGLDAGLIVSWSAVTGSSSRRPARDTTLSPGGRVGLHAAWSEQRLLSPFLGAYASVFPLPPELLAEPQGTVGHLPYFWLGLSGGLALAL